jgi:hypothetical protein
MQLFTSIKQEKDAIKYEKDVIKVASKKKNKKKVR